MPIDDIRAFQLFYLAQEEFPICDLHISCAANENFQESNLQISIVHLADIPSQLSALIRQELLGHKNFDHLLRSLDELCMCSLFQETFFQKVLSFLEQFHQ